MASGPPTKPKPIPVDYASPPAFRKRPRRFLRMALIATLVGWVLAFLALRQGNLMGVALFPYVALAWAGLWRHSLPFGPHSLLLVGLAGLNLPVYGLVLELADRKGRLGIAATVLVIVHLFAVVAAVRAMGL